MDITGVGIHRLSIAKCAEFSRLMTGCHHPLLQSAAPPPPYSPFVFAFLWGFAILAWIPGIIIGWHFQRVFFTLCRFRLATCYLTDILNAIQFMDRQYHRMILIFADCQHCDSSPRQLPGTVPTASILTTETEDISMVCKASFGRKGHLSDLSVINSRAHQGIPHSHTRILLLVSYCSPFDLFLEPHTRFLQKLPQPDILIDAVLLLFVPLYIYISI